MSTDTSPFQHYGMENQFDEVITNPAKFNEDGLLELKRRVDPNGKQHECKVGCSPNMCKGEQSVSTATGPHLVHFSESSCLVSSLVTC